eukprot:12296_1
MASVDLDKDMITAGLEAEYGDVDVTVEDTEENGEQKDQNENDLLLIVVHVEHGHGCSCCGWVHQRRRAIIVKKQEETDIKRLFDSSHTATTRGTNLDEKQDRGKVYMNDQGS